MVMSWWFHGDIIVWWWLNRDLMISWYFKVISWWFNGDLKIWWDDVRQKMKNAKLLCSARCTWKFLQDSAGSIRFVPSCLVASFPRTYINLHTQTNIVNHMAAGVGDVQIARELLPHQALLERLAARAVGDNQLSEVIPTLQPIIQTNQTTITVQMVWLIIIIIISTFLFYLRKPRAFLSHFKPILRKLTEKTPG